MDEDRQEVVITDIRVPFWSLVWILVKLAIAAIPACIILFLLGVGLALLLELLGGGQRW